MHHSFTILALTLAGLRSGVFANPLPQYSFPDSNAQCAANANPGPEYENTSERRTTGEPIQIGASCTPNGDNECQLGRENSYTVGVTTTVGADLGLSYADVFSAGFNAEVSYSEEEDTTNTNQQVCGGPWSCSMILTPAVQEVAGNVWRWGGCPSKRRNYPYTIQFPIISEGELPVQNSELCQCRNLDGFDEGAEDAPVPCPEECAG